MSGHLLTRLSPSSELDIELKIGADVVESSRIVVGALRSSTRSENVGQELSVASLLVRHELQEIAVVLCHASFLKLRYGESFEAIIEEIELQTMQSIRPLTKRSDSSQTHFDPLLVKAEIERRVVKVGDSSVDRLLDGGVAHRVDDCDSQSVSTISGDGRVGSGTASTSLLASVVSGLKRCC